MTDAPLVTLRQIADELTLPESTVRYYRDAFLDHIPLVGTGRRRRYPAAAVAVLRSIASGYAEGRSRAEIIASLGGQGTSLRTTRPGADGPVRSIAIEDVTNLDLLAAILDGEREQRDALWQMAKEIVRLTGVLESQDSVLTEIAGRAGVIVSDAARVGRPPVAAIAPADTQAPHDAPDAADIDRLRAELEAERALVERLRESKLDLEHRAADAEAALEDRGKRRPSVIRRLLGDESGR